MNDMYADAVLAIVLRVDTDPQAKKIAVQRITKPDLQREFRDRLEVIWLCSMSMESPSALNHRRLISDMYLEAFLLNNGYSPVPLHWS